MPSCDHRVPGALQGASRSLDALNHRNVKARIYGLHVKGVVYIESLRSDRTCERK